MDVRFHLPSPSTVPEAADTGEAFEDATFVEAKKAGRRPSEPAPVNR
jgi:hypothetical protein